MQTEFHDRPRARATDPDTSHEAAVSVTNVGQTQRYILEALFLGMLTDEDLLEEVTYRHGSRFTPSGVRSRRSELVKRGLVEAGPLGITRAGRKCQVWKLTEQGRDYLESTSGRQGERT